MEILRLIEAFYFSTSIFANIIKQQFPSSCTKAWQDDEKLYVSDTNRSHIVGLFWINPFALWIGPLVQLIIY